MTEIKSTGTGNSVHEEWAESHFIHAHGCLNEKRFLQYSTIHLELKCTMIESFIASSTWLEGHYLSRFVLYCLFLTEV